jgi:hypothetical protein
MTAYLLEKDGGKWQVTIYRFALAQPHPARNDKPLGIFWKTRSEIFSGTKKRLELARKGEEMFAPRKRY